jgi:hypothetical protein
VRADIEHTFMIPILHITLSSNTVEIEAEVCTTTQ